MTPTWFLLVFLFSGSPTDNNYVDKVAIPMTGKMDQHCAIDKNKIWRYNSTTEGTDNHKVLTVCVPAKEWRGEK